MCCAFRSQAIHWISPIFYWATFDCSWIPSNMTYKIWLLPRWQCYYRFCCYWLCSYFHSPYILRPCVFGYINLFSDSQQIYHIYLDKANWSLSGRSSSIQFSFGLFPSIDVFWISFQSIFFFSCSVHAYKWLIFLFIWLNDLFDSLLFIGFICAPATSFIASIISSHAILIDFQMLFK